MLPMCLGVAVFSEEVIFIYAGDKYSNISPVLTLSCVMRIIVSIESVMTNLVLYANNKEKKLVQFTFVFGICNLVNTEPEIQGFVTFLSAGITMFCVGVYDIIGTVLEFKHVLVSLQLTSHIPFQNINPRRDWTKSEKREYIGVGIIFIILGLAFITIFALIQFGILK